MPSSTAATSPIVSLHGVKRSFGDTQVLDGISLTVAPRESVCLIGRSGCGKSTVLKILSGLLTADAGEVRLSANCAIGFQDSRLVPWLRLWDNITLGMTGSRAERRTVAQQALDSVQLSTHTDAWPRELSGGQAQRAALARALVRHPDLLLLDEPFGALDALTRLDMQDLLADLKVRHHWATLMVTHDISEAVRLSDRVLVLKDGRISRELRIERSQLDEEGRPHNHTQLEEILRRALR